MKKYIIFAIIIILLIVLDQVTKTLILRTMDLGDSYVVIENFFEITSHRNKGASWGMFQGQLTFFYITTIVAYGFFAYLAKDIDFKKKPMYTIAILLLIAGTTGNFIDRILYQEVVDFLDFIIVGYDFPIFNVADMCLVIGAFALGIDVVFGGHHHEKN